MKKYSLPILLTVAGFLLVGFIMYFAANPKRQPLVIVHFNDTHSNFEPILGGRAQGKGGVIERAAFIREQRDEAGEDNLLLLHAGDWSQGSVYFTALDGDMEVDVINALRYDAVALGNHEFDNGNERLAERVARINCPVVCANYVFDEKLASVVKPYAIVEKAGRKIGIIGLLADISTLVYRGPEDKADYLDPVPVVNELAAKLKDEEGCDLVILLSHLGAVVDKANPDGIIDKEVAASSRNVDIIVGGHSHTLFDEMDEVADLDGHLVRIVQAGEYGMYGGKLTVD